MKDERSLDKKILARLKELAKIYYNGDFVEMILDFITFIEQK